MSGSVSELSILTHPGTHPRVGTVLAGVALCFRVCKATHLSSLIFSRNFSILAFLFLHISVTIIRANMSLVFTTYQVFHMYLVICGHNNPIRGTRLYSCFRPRRTLRLREVINLPQITQPGTGAARMKTSRLCSQALCNVRFTLLFSDFLSWMLH